MQYSLQNMYYSTKRGTITSQTRKENTFNLAKSTLRCGYQFCFIMNIQIFYLQTRKEQSFFHVTQRQIARD